jgi:hypothetical protein
MRETIHAVIKCAENRFYAAQRVHEGGETSPPFDFVSDSPAGEAHRTRRRTCAVCRATLDPQETRRGWTHLYCSNACRQTAKRHRAALRTPGPNAWIHRRTPGGPRVWIVETPDARFRIETDAGVTLETRRTYAGAYAAAAVAALDFRCIGFQPALTPDNPTQNDDNN